MGTGLTAPRRYIFRVTEVLREMTNLPLARAENLMDPTANADAFVEVSGILKAHAANLVKICGDLRWMSAFGEIRLPKVQAGSSIMPGKVNPVILGSGNPGGVEGDGGGISLSPKRCPGARFRFANSCPCWPPACWRRWTFSSASTGFGPGTSTASRPTRPRARVGWTVRRFFHRVVAPLGLHRGRTVGAGLRSLRRHGRQGVFWSENWGGKSRRPPRARPFAGPGGPDEPNA
ncbi:MAG: hypothetical protein IPJ35_05425 [Elusimicrobia bacterium]|nr:hypothetical protein [Elusimicrobiota bacterium]